MSSVTRMPANEGASFKNEQENPEIVAMALKMKETIQNSATTLRQQVLPATNVNINRAGTQVSLNAAAISSSNASKKTTQEKSKDSVDFNSILGKFGWKTIGTHPVPYIVRAINKENFLFVSVRVAETKLLSNYLHRLHVDIFTVCKLVRSHFITESEAKLLNEINQEHNDLLYGKEPFITGKDCIVRLEDVQEFYLFIQECYKRLIGNFTPGPKEKCGFIRINSETVVPYCTKDDLKYVPLFYFEGDTENMRHQTIKLENWDLAYLKFCCKILGIRNNLYVSNSCIVTSLDVIKSYFPPDTNFEECWPAKITDLQLLIHQDSIHVNPPGCWIKTPCTILNPKPPVPENIVHPMPPPQSIAPLPSIPVGVSLYQNEWPSNQMNSAVVQQINNSNLMNNQPLLLVQTSIPTTSTQIISNNVGLNQNIAPTSHLMATMFNSTEIIDLSSPPSSPGPQTSAPQPRSHVSISWNLKKIAERQWMAHSPPNAAYKIETAFFRGIMVRCINSKPFKYEYPNLLVSLDDLVQDAFPYSSVPKCAYILTKHLNITLYKGNSEQIAVLKENGLLMSNYADNTPLAMLHDIMYVFLQLEVLLKKLNVHLTQYRLSARGSAQRHCTS